MNKPSLIVKGVELRNTKNLHPSATRFLELLAMLMYGMMDLYSLDVKSDSMEDSTKIHTEYCIRCNNYVSHSLCRFDAHWDAVHEVRLLGEKMGWLNLCSAV